MNEVDSPAGALSPDSHVVDPASDQDVLLLKVLVVGEGFCGKTSLVQRYVHGKFSASYKCTFGVDFALKELVLDGGRKVQMQLWDTAGQERFASVNTHYFRGACGALVVFAPDVPQSFERTEVWKKMVDEYARAPSGSIPVMLVCNKCDLITGEPLQRDEHLDAWCKQHGFMSWIRTSAKLEVNLDTAMIRLVRGMLEEYSGSVHQAVANSATVHLESQQQQAPARKTTCCTAGA